MISMPPPPNSILSDHIHTVQWLVLAPTLITPLFLPPLQTPLASYHPPRLTNNYQTSFISQMPLVFNTYPTTLLRTPCPSQFLTPHMHNGIKYPDTSMISMPPPPNSILSDHIHTVQWLVLAPTLITPLFLPPLQTPLASYHPPRLTNNYQTSFISQMPLVFNTYPTTLLRTHPFLTKVTAT